MSRKGANLALEAAKNSSPCRTAQRRMFSSSFKRQKTAVIPVFQKTSSKELDHEYAVLRDTVIVPAYLSRSQRNMIYKQRYRDVLENENMVANIAGEMVRLTPANFRKESNTLTGFYRVLTLMAEKQDANNIPGLLEGLRKANSSIMRQGKAAKDLISALRDADRHDILIECLRRSSDTGLTLRSPELAELAMRSMYIKALQSDFDVNHTKKSLHWAEMLLDMMEDPKHSFKLGDPASSNDPRASPDNIAVPTALAAVRASKHLGGNDEEGKVERFSRTLLYNWNNIRPVQPGHTPNKQLAHKNKWLFDTMHILHATTAAERVLDPSSDVAVKLKEKSSKLEEDARSVFMEIDSSAWGKEAGRQGPAMYRRVYNIGAS